MKAHGSPDGADNTLHVLLVGRDRSFEDEFRTALSGVADVHGVVYVADTYRQALDIARGRQPNFVLIDIDRDAGEVAALSKDLHEVLPRAAIAGAYKLDDRGARWIEGYVRLKPGVSWVQNTA